MSHKSGPRGRAHKAFVNIKRESRTTGQGSLCSIVTNCTTQGLLRFVAALLPLTQTRRALTAQAASLRWKCGRRKRGRTTNNGKTHSTTFCCCCCRVSAQLRVEPGACLHQLPCVGATVNAVRFVASSTFRRHPALRHPKPSSAFVLMALRSLAQHFCQDAQRQQRYAVLIAEGSATACAGRSTTALDSAGTYCARRFSRSPRRCTHCTPHRQAGLGEGLCSASRHARTQTPRSTQHWHTTLNRFASSKEHAQASLSNSGRRNGHSSGTPVP